MRVEFLEDGEVVKTYKEGKFLDRRRVLILSKSYAKHSPDKEIRLDGNEVTLGDLKNER